MIDADSTAVRVIVSCTYVHILIHYTRFVVCVMIYDAYRCTTTYYAGATRRTCIRPSELKSAMLKSVLSPTELLLLASMIAM